MFKTIMKLFSTKSLLNSEFTFTRSFDVDSYSQIKDTILNNLKGKEIEYVSDNLDSAIFIYEISDKSYLRVFISGPWEVIVCCNDKSVLDMIENQIKH